MPLVLDDFKRLLKESVSTFSNHWLNSDQETAAFASPNHPLFILAGAGAGKTTALAVRILYLVFVEGFLPETIMATTFTKKAANELRSRILAWGNTLKAHIQECYSNNPQILNWVNQLDINKVITGTLDAIAQEAIEDDRQTAEITPVVIDQPMAKGLLRKNILFGEDGLYQNTDLKNSIASIEHASLKSINVPKMLDSILQMSDRIIQDIVDVDAFSSASSENKVLADTIRKYWDYLDTNNYVGFAQLERVFYNRIADENRLLSLQNIRAIFVDEFQDTNPIQEAIYYALCKRFGASLTVVGDDDQSIYRFRGATVEIFSQFESRIVKALGSDWAPRRVDLHINYRSTSKIVDYSSRYIALDSGFTSARTQGKLCVEPYLSCDSPADNNPPVLGLFRNTQEELARDLSAFLTDIFNGNGWAINVGKPETQDCYELLIARGSSGNWGDAVMLARTANEYSSATQYSEGNPRLPLLLRQELAKRGISVFNPRGRRIIQIPSVQHCLGLILLCIDNNGRILSDYVAHHSWAQNASQRMNIWKNAANAYMNDEKTPDRNALRRFVADWVSQRPSNGQQWPADWPLVELLFTLMRWIPEFQNDPEGQIYLEVLARAITTGGRLSTAGGKILFNEQYHDWSVKEIYAEVMLPLANGEIDADEEIMPNVPRNYFPIMTIHQAKGLEFPLVIVDVGSDFKTDHHTQRRFRFPTDGGSVHYTENAFAPFSEIGAFRTARSEVERAFDDLRRQYFVANTRPQNILLLTGLMKLTQNRGIKSVQCGYSMDGMQHLRFVSAEDWNSSCGSECIMLI